MRKWNIFTLVSYLNFPLTFLYNQHIFTAPQCPENEYYSNCTNGDCSVQNCTDLGLPITCLRINPKYCKKGCLCNQGYARNAKGICVPLKECRKYTYIYQDLPTTFNPN